MKPKHIALVCLALAVGFAMVASLGGYCFIKGLRSKSWLRVQAKIINNSPSQYPDSGMEHYDVNYSYEVNGVEYRGHKWAYALFNPQIKCEKLRKGDVTLIYYNPASPDEAVVYSGAGTIDALIPFIFGGLSILAIFGGWKVYEE